MTDGNGENPGKPTFRGLRPTQGETKAEADARKYVESDEQPADLSVSKQDFRQMEQMERLIGEVRSLRTLHLLWTVAAIVGGVLILIGRS